MLAQTEDETHPPTTDPSRPKRSRRRADRPLSFLPATEPLPTWLWHEPSMTAALAERDMATVYRLLQEHGLSQRSIAARTGQSQSEISEVMSGRRIVSYDVLVRIAEGLGVSRGYLGLAYHPPGPYRRPEAVATVADEDCPDSPDPGLPYATGNGNRPQWTQSGATS